MAAYAQRKGNDGKWLPHLLFKRPQRFGSRIFLPHLQACVGAFGKPAAISAATFGELLKVIEEAHLEETLCAFWRRLRLRLRLRLGCAASFATPGLTASIGCFCVHCIARACAFLQG